MLFVRENKTLQEAPWPLKSGRIKPEIRCETRIDPNFKGLGILGLTSSDSGLIVDWEGNVNRSQIRDGAAILGDVVPLVVEILMDHPSIDWGQPIYPVVEAEQSVASWLARA